MPLTAMGQLTFVDVPISSAVLATTDIELIGLRAVLNKGASGSKNEKCVGNDLNTLQAEAVAEFETLLQNQRKALIRGKTNTRRKLVNCNDICRNIAQGHCVRLNPLCRGWRDLVSNEMVEGQEEMNASIENAVTATTAMEQGVPGSMERKMNDAAIERCQLLKDAIKIEFETLYAEKDLTNKCLTLMAKTISLECLLVA